jgi:uncharacterized protein YciW
MSAAPAIESFTIKDCALAALATGLRAQNLRELRDRLQTVHPGSIYYHFWGGLLRPRFDDPEYNNDFASWARHGLHDTTLAERLAVIDPGGFVHLEQLRQEILDVIDERLDETEHLTWAPRDRQFQFIRAQTVVFDTGRRVDDAAELAAIVPTLSLGSIYYHVVDARRREPPGMDDFRAWLEQFNDAHAELRQRLAEVDPYFLTLAELRSRLAAIFQDYFHGRRA